MSRDRVLDHLTDMVEATDLPINADFEHGFAPDAAGVGDSVRLAAESGVAGCPSRTPPATTHRRCSIWTPRSSAFAPRARPSTRPAATPCWSAAPRGFLVGQPDIEHIIARLKAYANAGADCLYAPGIRTADHIRAVVAAVSPKPVNLLMGWPGDLTLKEIADLGVRRVSVGGALARSAWGGFIRAAKMIAEQGRFDGFAGAASGSELDDFFHRQHP